MLCIIRPKLVRSTPSHQQHPDYTLQQSFKETAIMLASQSSYDSSHDIRIHRFNDALDKFLELIDERATNKNFQTALPHLDANLLDSARKQFVFHLKDAIKVSCEYCKGDCTY